MKIVTWSVGDLTNLPPFALPPNPPCCEDGDLILLNVEAPQWRLFQLFEVLQRGGAGAIAVPVPMTCHGMIVWSRIPNLPCNMAIPLPSDDSEVMVSNQPDVLLEHSSRSDVEVTPLSTRDEILDASPFDRDNLIAIYPLSQATSAVFNKLELSVAEIGAATNVLVLAPSFKGEIGLLKPDRFKDQLLTIRVEEILTIQTISELVEEGLQKNGVSSEAFAIIDQTYANKYVMKSLENVAVNYFRDFQFVLFDHEHHRKQFSKDGIDWRTEETAPRTSEGLFGLINEKHETDAPKPAVPFQVTSSSPTLQAQETSKEVLKKDEPSNVSHSHKERSEFDFVLDSKERRDAILKRRKITEAVWKYREFLTSPVSWSLCGDKYCAKVDSADASVSNASTSKSSSAVTATFQHVALTSHHTRFVIETNPPEMKACLYFSKEKPKGRMIAFWKYVCHKGQNIKNYVYDSEFHLNDWNEKDIRRYFGGGWFEELVRCSLEDIKDPNKKPCDWGFASNLHTTENELDVIVLSPDNKRLFVFECKTGRNVNQESVAKLEGIVRKLAQKKNLDAIGILVCLQKTTVINHVQDSDSVACIWGSKIPKYIQTARFYDMKPGDVLGDE